MKIQQQIEIKVAGPDNAAFAQIVVGAKRSAQKRYESLEVAMRGSEELVAKYGALIAWARPEGFLADTIAMVGTYEIEGK
jgi:hypothetical protein